MRLSTETRLLFILLASFVQLVVIAQPLEPRFDHFTINDGLSSNQITHILQDRKGFLWISTKSGLNKFDGHTFRHFKFVPDEINSLSDNEVNFIYEDSKGALWIATQDGLNIFDPITEIIRHFPLNDSLVSNEITAVGEDKYGNIWIGTRKGVIRFDQKQNRLQTFTFNPANKKGLNSNNIKAIQLDKNGYLWVGTTKGLSKFNYDTRDFETFLSDSTNPNSISGNMISYIAKDRSGNLWIGTSSGLSKLVHHQSKIEFENYFFNNDSESSKKLNRIKSFDQDSKGNLWIGTIGGGLIQFNPATGSYFNYQYSLNDLASLNDNEIFSVCVDIFDNVWAGSPQKGVSKFSPAKARFDLFKIEKFTIKDIPANDITAIYTDDLNQLWLGTNGNGISVFHLDENHWPSNLLFELRKEEKGGLGSNYITAIIKDKEGIYWIGTLAGGLNKFNPYSKKIEVFKSYSDDPSSISNNYINAVFEDSEGYIWVGTSAGGLNKFDKKTNKFTRFTFAPGNFKNNSVNSPEVTCINEDSDGNLWVGTTIGGLNKYNRKENNFTYYTTTVKNRNSVNNRNISCIYKDNKNRLWIGTLGGGLNLFENNSFKHFTEQNGFVSNIILSITEDEESNLWLTTSRGVSRFNPDTKDIRNYDEGDGLQGREFNPGVVAKHSVSGVLFFGGVKGLNIYNRKSIIENRFPPQIVIVDFKLFNKPVLPGEDSPIKESISFAKEIILSHDQDVISFSFASLDFISPSKNQYAYMLEGFDNDWVYVGNNREVTYTNLNSGDYIFKVKATNSDGVWNETGAQIKLTIRPPFWATWWAYTIYFISLIAVLYFIRYTELKRRIKKEEDRLRREREEARLREAELKAKNITQEKEIEKQKIRNRIAQDLHDEIGSNLSSISLMSELIQNDEKINAEASEKIKRIHKVAKDSTQSIRDIVWLTNPSSDSVKDLIAKMQEVADNVLGKFNLNFDYPKEISDINLPPETKRNLFFIYKETLNNIVKHAEAKNVDIKLQVEKGSILLSIKDDGTGFNALENFGGNGLKNIRSRVNEINADLKFESNPGKGTILELIVNITQMRD